MSASHYFDQSAINQLTSSRRIHEREAALDFLNDEYIELNDEFNARGGVIMSEPKPKAMVRIEARIRKINRELNEMRMGETYEAIDFD
tara:strand:- start:1806 stop:2069 length:264 start_codon:yes stop_codon:yes gene_type:complete